MERVAIRFGSPTPAMPSRAREFGVLDPDGNLVGFWERR
jgi:hypothetical protein